MTAPAVVSVELGARSYPVYVGTGAFDAVLEVAAREARGGRVVIVADRNVAALADRCHAALGDRVRAVGRVELPAGEAAKTLGQIGESADRILSDPLERQDVLIGIGGGAATDVAGFLAAVLLRGVRWISVPTTLLGQVDAAVGGKTGVNAPAGKNLIGAFHQPLAVACDPGTLATLPEREFRAGLAEVVKTAWIGDPELFEQLEKEPPQGPDAPSLADIVRRCVAVKAEVVSEDEREAGRRATLNFGHTIGHAIETESAGRYLHGEAVSLGLVAALFLSCETGRVGRAELERMERCLEAMGLPVRDASLDPDAIVARTRQDKKRRDGADRYQLTTGIGQVSVAEDLPEGAPRAAVEYLRR